MKSAAQNPSGAMASIAGGVPAGPVQNAVKKAFADAERLAAQHPYRFMPEGTGTRYAGGRGAGAGGGGSDPFAANMSKMMGQFMNQLGGADGKQKDPLAGLKTIAFVARTKGPQAVAEDPKINLFDRISYRYYSLSYQGLGNSGPAGAPAQEGSRAPAAR